VYTPAHKTVLEVLLRRLVVATLCAVPALGTASPTEGPGADRRNVVYGGSSDFAPYEYLDERGVAQGFNVELVRAMARAAGEEIEVVLGPWEQTVADLDRGRVDLSALYFTEERAAKYDFLAKGWSMQLSLAFLPGRAAYPTGLDDLHRETVGTRSSTLPERMLLALPPAQRPEIVPFASVDQGLRLLAGGRVNAVFFPELALEVQAQRQGLQLVTVPVTNLAYYFVGHRAEPSRLGWVAPALEQLREDGTFDRLVEEHLALKQPAPGRWRYGGLVVGGLLLGLLGSVAWTRSLKVRVAARTRELSAAVDARSRAEEALRASERVLQLMAESSPDMMMVRDMERRLLYVSPSIEKLTGYSMGDVQNGFVSWFHPDDAERINACYESLYQGRRVDGELFRLITRGGELKWISASWGPLLDENGRQVGVFGVDHDVSELKRAEDRRRELENGLREAQKLESLGILAGGIAHDFNNLLATILSSASLARKRVSPDSREHVWLERIEQASERAALLTNQMLAYAGRRVPALRPLDLSALVSDMRPRLEAIAPKGTLFDLDLAHGLPPVRGDAEQLRQLVLNMVSNAAESLVERDGRITLRTAAVELAPPRNSSEPPDGHYVRLEVGDNGCGMDAATRSRVFDPFFSTKFTGRGLGMAAALGIVRVHQGTIEVDSEPGTGSRFRVLLPVAAPAGDILDS
jgi:PAS domain S-box-containing protein